jgi:hypothetical protein
MEEGGVLSQAFDLEVSVVLVLLGAVDDFLDKKILKNIRVLDLVPHIIL